MPVTDEALNDAIAISCDIGRHACNEAMQSIVRKIETLPSDLHRALAMGVCVGLMQSKCDGLINMGDGMLDRTLRTTAAKTRAVANTNGEQLLGLLREGKLKEAAKLAGLDHTEFE